MEAAESLFHPVAIRNNVGGYDKEILDRYKEPTWNNPVVRFVGADGKDVIPRKDRVWETGPLVGRMHASLAAAKQDIPAWFKVLAAETASGEVETAVFAMT